MFISFQWFNQIAITIDDFLIYQYISVLPHAKTNKDPYHISQFSVKLRCKNVCHAVIVFAQIRIIIHWHKSPVRLFNALLTAILCWCCVGCPC